MSNNDFTDFNWCKIYGIDCVKLYINSLVNLDVYDRKWSEVTLVGNKTISQRQSNEINTHKIFNINVLMAN